MIYGPVFDSGSFITYKPSGGITTATINWPEAQPTGKSMTTHTRTVRVKAGYLGQVYANDVNATILWESKPKKSLAKADKAAKKAQLRAAQRSFE
jgi:hypothetical protein